MISKGKNDAKTGIAMEKQSIEHICFLTPSFFPVVGGAEVNIHELGKRLVETGYKISLVTPKFGNAKSYEEIDGIKVYRIRRIPKFLACEQMLQVLKILQINLIKYHIQLWVLVAKKCMVQIIINTVSKKNLNKIKFQLIQR